MSEGRLVTYVCPSCKAKTIKAEGGFISAPISVPICEECNCDMELDSLVRSLLNKIFN